MAGVVIHKDERAGVKRIIARLLRDNSSFALAAGSGVIAPAVGLLAAPILTRLYSPSDFGVLGTFAAIMAAALSIVTLRYEVAIPLARTDEDAYSLSRALIKICAAMSLLATGVFLVIGPRVFDATMFGTLMKHIWWLPVALFLAGTNQVLTNFAIRRGAFGDLAAARLTQGITGPGVQIGAGVAGWGLVGLLLGQAASQTGGLVRLWSYLQRAGKNIQNLPSATALLKRFSRFPKVSLFPAFLNAFGLQLPILIVGRAYGVHEAGLVAFIMRIAGVPIGIFSAAATQVLLSEGARCRREGLSATPLLNRTIRRQMVIYAPALLVTPLLPWAFPVLFGPKWLDAGYYAVALIPALLVQGILAPTGTILDINERQDLHFLREIVRVAVIFVAVFTSRFWGGTMWAIMVSLSAALVVNSMFGYALALHSAKRDTLNLS